MPARGRPGRGGVRKRAKWQNAIPYSMYVHNLHITTLYTHSYTYPPTLSSHMLT